MKSHSTMEGTSTARSPLFLLLVAMLLHPGAIALQCFKTTQHGDVLGVCMELEGDPGGVADVCCTIQVQSFGFAGSHAAGNGPAGANGGHCIHACARRARGGCDKARKDSMLMSLTGINFECAADGCNLPRSTCGRTHRVRDSSVQRQEERLDQLCVYSSGKPGTIIPGCIASAASPTNAECLGFPSLRRAQRECDKRHYCVGITLLMSGFSGLAPYTLRTGRAHGFVDGADKTAPSGPVREKRRAGTTHGPADVSYTKERCGRHSSGSAGGAPLPGEALISDVRQVPTYPPTPKPTPAPTPEPDHPSLSLAWRQAPGAIPCDTEHGCLFAPGHGCHRVRVVSDTHHRKRGGRKRQGRGRALQSNPAPLVPPGGLLPPPSMGTHRGGPQTWDDVKPRQPYACLWPDEDTARRRCVAWRECAGFWCSANGCWARAEGGVAQGLWSAANGHAAFRNAKSAIKLDGARAFSLSVHALAAVSSASAAQASAGATELGGCSRGGQRFPVRLRGLTHGRPAADCMGTYMPLVGTAGDTSQRLDNSGYRLVGGRPAYAMRQAVVSDALAPGELPAPPGQGASIAKYLFYDALLKLWVVAPRLLQAPYNLVIKSRAHSPDQALGGWQLFGPWPVPHGARDSPPQALPTSPPVRTDCILATTPAPNPVVLTTRPPLARDRISGTLPTSLCRYLTVTAAVRGAAVPDDRLQQALGRYKVRTTALLGGRPVYVRRRITTAVSGALKGTVQRDIQYLFFDQAEKQWAIGPNLGVAPYTLAVRSATHDPQTIAQELDSDGETLRWALTDADESPSDVRSKAIARTVAVVCKAHTLAPTPVPTPTPTRLPTPVPATAAPTPFQNPWAHIEAVLTIANEARPFYTFQRAFRRGIAAVADVPMSDVQVLKAGTSAAAMPGGSSGTSVRFRLRVRHHLAICRTGGKAEQYDDTVAATACTAEAMARAMAMPSYQRMLQQHLRAGGSNGALRNVRESELHLSGITAKDAYGKSMLSSPLASPALPQHAVGMAALARWQQQQQQQQQQQRGGAVQRSTGQQRSAQPRPHQLFGARVPADKVAAIAIALAVLCAGCLVLARRRKRASKLTAQCGEADGAHAEMSRVGANHDSNGGGGCRGSSGTEERTALLGSAQTGEPSPSAAAATVSLGNAGDAELKRHGVIDKLVRAHDNRIAQLRKSHEDALAEQANEEADAFADAFAGAC